MTYVVTENCIKCKLTDCVEVCPVDCFYETDNMLVINPEECIDCGACVPACPVEAIFLDEDVAKEQEDFISLNASIAQETPILFAQREPDPEAESYRSVQKKRHLLSR